MKRNLLLTLSAGTAILLATTGCLPEKQQAADPTPAPQVDPRDALIKAMDTQATGFIDGINNVVIAGNFLKNLSLQNPPQPIPLETENDVKKAVDYLFSNETADNSSFIYHPDSRICSEIIAKDKPSTCEQIMAKLAFRQTPKDAESGYVEVEFDGTFPLVMIYSGSLVSVTTQLDELVKTLQHIDSIKVQNGEPSMAADLPTTHSGTAVLTVATQMGTSIVDVTATQAINVAGTNKDGQNYSVQIAAGNNIATLALTSALGAASLTLNLPQAALNIPARDQQNVTHNVSVNFPGLSGLVTLDNSLSKIAASAIKLGGPDIFASVDGQAAVHLNAPNDINADLISSIGGNLTLSVSSEFNASLEVSANPLISQTGSVSAFVAANTQVYFAKASPQAKVLQGEFKLIGTQDFTANLDAQSNSCFAGAQNMPIYLETVVCQ